MSEYGVVWGLISMFLFYCVPMLKRMDALEERMFHLENEIRSIKKALYVMPDDGGDAE